MPHSLQSSLNYLNMNPYSYTRLASLGPIYSSPVNALGIRRGRIFLELQPQKKKISQLMRGIDLYVSGSPLIVGLMHELNNSDGGLGIRCRAEKVEANVKFRQEIGIYSFTNIKPIAELSPDAIDVDETMKKSSQAGWSIPHAHIEVLALEARTVYYGAVWNESSSNEGMVSNSHESRGFGSEEDLGVIDLDWFNDDDYNNVEDVRDLRMEAFGWAPKLLFFRNKEDDGGLHMHNHNHGN